MSVVAAPLGIPVDILENEYLNNAITAGLPPNYNFEIHKTVWRIRQSKADNVVLQFPEGLLIFAPIISDIIETFTGASVVIMGDPTYGACCVGDGQASALGADFLVHYGHSCLMSIKEADVKNMMYVFVHVTVDAQHFTKSIAAHLPRDAVVALFATVQFAPQLRRVAAALCPAIVDTPPVVARRAPLSGAEVLGCTAPLVDESATHMVFLADGRFHIEAALIANPHLPTLRYCPLVQRLTVEKYDHKRMLAQRLAAVTTARRSLGWSKPPLWGVVLGTLGRQGSPRVVERVVALARAAGARVFVALIREISPQRLALLGHTEVPTESGVGQGVVDGAEWVPADEAGGGATGAGGVGGGVDCESRADGGGVMAGGCADNAVGRSHDGLAVEGAGGGVETFVVNAETGERRPLMPCGDAARGESSTAAAPAATPLLHEKVDVWVQAACPRLSIDWGCYFATVPVLTPYEVEVAVGATEWRKVYPMDHYAKDGGAWAYHTPKLTTSDDVESLKVAKAERRGAAPLPAAADVVAPMVGGGRLRERPAIEVQ